MGKVISGQFGRPRKPIETSLHVDLDHFTLTVDGEEWLAYVLNGELVGAVPIEPGTAPDTKRLAKVIRMAKKRLSEPCQSVREPEP